MPRPLLLGVIAFAGSVLAFAPAPVIFEPGDWLGDDGNWSTSTFRLGSPAQEVNVLASTTLSEFWAVGEGGCYQGDPRCSSSRGGLYNPWDSTHWYSMGAWNLGLEWLGIGANGLYGLDSLVFFSPQTDTAVTMSNVLVAAFNTSSYFNGFFGLGITESRIQNQIAQSPLVQAVTSFGWIPSYSYGFTAGAWYRNAVSSVILGGYDATRFDDNGNQFTLDPKDNTARTVVRGIQAQADDPHFKPSSWNTSSQSIMSWDDHFTALIDSTTPFLWLPDGVCDSFAEALNLTYSDKFNLYTLTNDQYNAFSTLPSLSITFSLSSYDNFNNFGNPLGMSGVVNITVPITALVSTLQFPYQNEAIAYGAPAVPYLSLRKTSLNDTLIIGRSFLQEAYLVTRYDEATFSLYQAKFPTSGTNIVPIARPPDSPYPPPPAPTKDGTVSTGVKAGIAVGVVGSILSIFAVLIWCCCFRRSRRGGSNSRAKLKDNSDSGTASAQTEEQNQQKETSSIGSHEPPRTIRRILTKISRTRRSRRPDSGRDAEKTATATGPLVHPSEVPASEIYELPAPISPVELDGIEENDDYDIEHSIPRSETSHEASSYEATRRRIERQLQGPVPEYTPPMDGTLPPPEKMFHSSAAPSSAANPVHDPSPISNHGSSLGDGTGSLPRILPSPISPRENGSHDWIHGPPPITMTTPAHPPLPHLSTRSSADPLPYAQMTCDSMTRARSESDQSDSPISPPSVSLPSSAIPIQRTPIDTSRVVCLGHLPDHFRPPGSSPIPKISEPEPPSRHTTPPLAHLLARNQSQSTLGSNFTEEEQGNMPSIDTRVDGTDGGNAAMFSQRSEDQPADSHTDSLDVLSRERIDPGLELIHVPQMANKRYSWEEGS